MFGDFPLPTWARRIQQSPWFQYVAVPLLTIFGLSVWHCIDSDVTKLSLTCLKAGAAAAANSALFYLLGAGQHSPGSKSFNPDGTKKEGLA